MDSSKLTKLDMFGVNYNFLINGTDKFRTTSGALLTILYIIILICLFIGFGVDLYQRRRPKVFFDAEIKEHKIFSLSNQNFTYAYRLENVYGQQIIDEMKVFHEISYFHYVMVNGTWVIQFSKRKVNKRCRDLPFTEEKEIYFNVSLKDWYCLDFDNITLGGNWDGNYLYGIVVKTKQCTNSTTRKCSSKEEIENFFSTKNSNSVFYSDMSIEVNPTMQDFDTPLKSNFINRYEILNLDLYRRKIQTFKTTSISNDKGWLFQNIFENFFISSDTIQSDFTLKEPWGNDVLYNQLIYLGRKSETYSRSYTKIQEVIADIGGFSKIFYFFLNFLFKFISNVYRNLYIMSSLQFENVKSYKNEKNEKNEKNFNKKISLNLDLDKARITTFKNTNTGNKNSSVELCINQSRDKLLNSHKNFENKNFNIMNDSKTILVKPEKSRINTEKRDSNYINKNKNKNLQNLLKDKETPTGNEIKILSKLSLPCLPNKIEIENSFEKENCKENLNENKIIYKDKDSVYTITSNFHKKNFDSKKIKKFYSKVYFLDYLKYKMCCLKRFTSHMKTMQLDNFDNVNHFMLKNLDILNYFKINKEVNYLKNLILEKSDREFLKAKKIQLKKSSIKSNLSSI
jgi:hypothetical protein